MAFKTFKLLDLLNHSDLTHCNGDEVNNYWPDATAGTIRLVLGGGDFELSLPYDTTLTLAVTGQQVEPVVHLGEVYNFSFQKLVTLLPKDIKPSKE